MSAQLELAARRAAEQVLRAVFPSYMVSLPLEHDAVRAVVRAMEEQCRLAAESALAQRGSRQTPPRTPVPSGVYWLPANSAFYRDDDQPASGANLMPRAFQHEWWPRRAEFPQSTPANSVFPY